jgi:hypothetical protein
MKAYGGADAYIRVFLTSALIIGEWSASRPRRFTTGERCPGDHWIGCWVGPRTGLDDVKKIKSRSYLDSNSEPSVVQPVANRYIDCDIPAPLGYERVLKFRI